MARFLKLVITITTSFFVIWLGGFLWFLTEIPRENTEIPDKEVDAIIVLTGGSNRVSEGVKLLEQNHARKMFVSGVGKGATVEEVLRENNYDQEFIKKIRSRIELGHKADDTTGNASETLEWMEAYGYGSMILVTSNYHIPRSLLELKTRMPDREIIPYPVFPGTVRIEKWWEFPGSRELILSEYNKFLVTSIKNHMAKR